VQNQWPNGQRNHKHQANLLVSYKCRSKIQWILLFLALVFFDTKVDSTLYLMYLSMISSLPFGWLDY